MLRQPAAHRRPPRCIRMARSAPTNRMDLDMGHHHADQRREDRPAPSRGASGARRSPRPRRPPSSGRGRNLAARRQRIRCSTGSSWVPDAVVGLAGVRITPSKAPPFAGRPSTGRGIRGKIEDRWRGPRNPCRFGSCLSDRARRRWSGGSRTGGRAAGRRASTRGWWRLRPRGCLPRGPSSGRRERRR